MKKNKIAKRFGIASLCLATALSAFSGIAPQTNSVALAEGEVALTDFVHTNAETVAQTTEYTNSAKTSTTKGLRISSDANYEGTFKTVFKGDTKLNFKFPEEYNTTTQEYYGNFRIRIADVDDQSKFFDVIYFSAMHSGENKPYTGVCIAHTTSDGIYMVRSSHYSNTLANPIKNNWYNGSVYNQNYQASTPCFRSKENSGDKGYALGSVALNWEGDVLTVQRTSFNGTVGPLAVFDGTYSATATKNGFVSKSTWGLPKMNFANGYTISFISNIATYYAAGVKTTTPETTDKGTDVLFTTIGTNGEIAEGEETGTFGTIYRFNQDTTTIAVDDNMTQFNDTFMIGEPTKEAGEMFIGWQNRTSGDLYPGTALLKKSEGYDPVIVSYDVLTGASVRLVVGGQSGLRFQTMCKADDFEKIKDYMVSFGTLLTYTDTLTTVGKDFTIANYTGQTSFLQVENKRGWFDYTADGTAYKAYTVAIVDIPTEEYTVKYSARGYINVKYADGITRTVYTDYNQAENSRSIADVANLLKANTTAYEALSTEKKAIIDAYAVAQN